MPASHRKTFGAFILGGLIGCIAVIVGRTPAPAPDSLPVRDDTQAVIAALCDVTRSVVSVPTERAPALSDELAESLAGLHGEMRALREQIAGVRSQLTADANAVGDRAIASEPDPPTRQEAYAYQRSQEDGFEVVREALQSARWTPEDSARLRQILPVLSPADRDSVLAELIPAINRGEILVEDDLFGL